MKKKEFLAGKQGVAPHFCAVNFRLQKHRAFYESL